VCYAQVCSLARERLAFIVAHACNSLALIVALVCNSPVHTHRALVVPHRPSSSLILSSIVRSSTLELENFLRSSLLIHAHSRERFVCVTLKYAPLLENVLRSSSLLLATALCTLIVLSSSLIVAHPIKHRAFIHARAGERLAFISSHMLAQPFHSSFITIALARKRLAFSTLKLENVLRTSCVHRCSSLLML